MRIALVALCFVALSSAALAGESSNWTMAAEVRGVAIEGKPLHFSPQEVLLLGRDGRVWEFAPGDAKNFRKTSDHFRPYSFSEMRDRLQRELGDRFEITASQHYLVAYPRGQRDLWAARFEELYRSFVLYFRTRGFHAPEPQFPLVAIVWPNQREFLMHAARQGAPVDPNVLGYYSLETNRITLYDVGDGRGTAQDRQTSIDTVIHEAAHQLAFNMAVHNRFAPPPRWVTEGLGTAFEAPGIWDPRNHPRATDRANQGRLKEFKYFAKEYREGTLAELIASDRFYSSQPSQAYAYGWALTHFLAETQPREYARYLQRTANRPPLQRYDSAQRMEDFTAVFGSNLRLTEARFMRFMEGVR